MNHRRHHLGAFIRVGLLALLSLPMACGARSVMEMPGNDTPGAGGAGGTLFATGGSAGTSQSTGGYGGSIVAMGGSGGSASATGGAGGGFIGGCAYPSCLWNLIRDCSADGQCTEDDTGANAPVLVIKLCCSNGVTENISVSASSTAIVGTVAVGKNGKKCYDVGFNAASDGSNAAYAWKDASGQTVAKGTLTSDGSMAVTCANGDSMFISNDCSLDGSTELHDSGTCK